MSIYRSLLYPPHGGCAILSLRITPHAPPHVLFGIRRRIYYLHKSTATRRRQNTHARCSFGKRSIKVLLLQETNRNSNKNFIKVEREGGGKMFFSALFITHRRCGGKQRANLVITRVPTRSFCPRHHRA